MPEIPTRRTWRDRVAAEPDDAIPVVPADSLPPARPPRRPRWRLRILLAFTVLLAVLYALSQLDPSTVKKLGPAGKYVFDLLHPGVEPEDISPAGKRLSAEVRAMGGDATFMERSHRFLGLFGSTERIHVRLNQREIGDAELAAVVKKYGDLIWGLDLRNTHVSDQGLRHLEGLSQIEQLTLGNEDSRFDPTRTIPVSPITDAGLVHLKGLKHSGLDALNDLPQLGSLVLSRTKVKGQGLARLKSLPTLIMLYLDGSDLTDEGMGSLAGALDLQILSVCQVPLTSKGLQSLRGLPRLNQLDLTGCGLLDEEVRDLTVDRPSLKIMRR
jgi:hypothetical protein